MVKVNSHLSLHVLLPAVCRQDWPGAVLWSSCRRVFLQQWHQDGPRTGGVWEALLSRTTRANPNLEGCPPVNIFHLCTSLHRHIVGLFPENIAFEIRFVPPAADVLRLLHAGADDGKPGFQLRAPGFVSGESVWALNQNLLWQTHDRWNRTERRR